MSRYLINELKIVVKILVLRGMLVLDKIDVFIIIIYMIVKNDVILVKIFCFGDVLCKFNLNVFLSIFFMLNFFFYIFFLFVIFFL